MAVIVLKFGGTSLHTAEAREALLRQVQQCKMEGNDMVVVVSAMGRSGDPYATDTLISILSNVHKEVDGKKKDLAISCGETISAALVAHLLDVHGLPSVALTGFQAGIITNNDFGNSEILHIDTKNICRYLDTNKIVVVAGFQGMTKDGEITTLGRGGSDTSAVTLGGYLGAERVDIFTDVPGIALVDPRIIPNPYFLEYISYDNMYKLASSGTKVIHPRAVLAAKKFQIPVRVRSTFSSGMGTLISEKDEDTPYPFIGISADKDIPCIQGISPSEYDRLGRISVFFRQGATDQSDKLKNLILEITSQAFDYSSGEDYISILLLKDHISHAIQQIYMLAYEQDGSRDLCCPSKSS
ncbi:aspartate kinase [Anaerosolibacter carboniphilus]|uniref:Aspartokinase n=1 Tax=Anaerosolibacter carboniphilus TaxID=1417629 RepID=A0A841KU02_9FIRM|nr:aspartate kinase [Anaerosolibacter carboniphilus]MBB6217066.1 aspartate kinase [Anaerosolibacter carboniphilus]